MRIDGVSSDAAASQQSSGGFDAMVKSETSASPTRAERFEARQQAREERFEARQETRADGFAARLEARPNNVDARTARFEARQEARADAFAERQAARQENFDASGGGGGGGVGGDVPSTPPVPTTNGQILGGITDAGVPILETTGDFTRDGGNVPIASVSTRVVAVNADGTRDVEITFTNDAPEGGTFLTPPWVAIQDGNFDIYDRGEAAAEFLERLAEDGTVSDIGEAFESSGAEGSDGVITGPGGAAAGPLDTGESGSIILTVHPAKSQFLSFASMVIPSNDAFISSPGDPRGIQIFDDKGNFIGQDVEIKGSDVLDAGTEVNTEQDAAFLNQSAPDTGVDEGGVVASHPGFIGSEGLPATDGDTSDAGSDFDFRGPQS